MGLRLVTTSEPDQTAPFMVDTKRDSSSTSIILATSHHTGKEPASVGFLFNEVNTDQNLVKLVNWEGEDLYLKNSSDPNATSSLPSGTRTNSLWSIIRPDGFKEQGGTTITLGPETSLLINVYGFKYVMNIEITKISSTLSGSANHSHSVSNVSNASFTLYNDGSAGSFFWKVLGF